MVDIDIRPAAQDDANAIANVYLASFEATYDFPLAHSDEEVRRWVEDVMVPTQEVWVAAAPDGVIVALMTLTTDMLDQLYVAPRLMGRGIGSRLLAVATARRPSGLDLYTFEVNIGARRFYERHGFVEVARGDGSDNEERQPDIRYAWRTSA